MKQKVPIGTMKQCYTQEDIETQKSNSHLPSIVRRTVRRKEKRKEYATIMLQENPVFRSFPVPFGLPL